MNRIRIYNDDEIKILLSNSNVEKIKNKSRIVYKNSFKLWAIKEKLFHEEKTARQIFLEGGFDMNILDDKTPQRRLCDWTKKYKKFGENYFNDNNKYSYKALKEDIKVNELEHNFINYIRKVVNNPKFVAFIIDRDKNNRLRITNLVSVEDEKTNN